MIQELQIQKPNPFSYIGQLFDFIRNFFAWWYGDIPLSLLSFLKRVLVILDDTTSFSIILKGFFKPWKNDYNIAGWLVGMSIKAVYLPIILVLFLLTIGCIVLALLAQLIILPIIIGLILLNPFLTP